MNIARPTIRVKPYLVLGIAVLLAILLFMTLVPTRAAGELSERLAGHILLQVELNGEAWYVDPVSQQRYLLGRPADAFAVMREQGLGVANDDFDAFAGQAPQRLAGRILLQVENKGQAYYVHPIDLSLHYLGRPVDAFTAMRNFGLGISNQDIAQVSKASSDSDHDGLSDDDEAGRGTDPYNQDSDRDGYMDGVEVNNGYDPLGPGRPANCQSNWQCTAWSTCNLGFRTRACTDHNNCAIEAGRPLEREACQCTPNWECSPWSDCADGQEARICRDLNTCNTNTDKPLELRSCQIETTCQPDWVCTDWGTCTDINQVRTCSDRNDCGETESKPAESQSCTMQTAILEKELIVDKLAFKMEFAAAWSPSNYKAADFFIEAISPSGQRYDETLCQVELPGSCNSLPGVVTRILRQDTLRAIGFSPVEPGRWQATLSYPAALTDAPGLSGFVFSNLNISQSYNKNLYTPGEPIVIQTVLSQSGSPVIWEDASAYVNIKIAHSQNTSANTPTIQMNDAGQGFDQQAGDGIYTGAYEDTTQTGSYCFEFVIEGINEIAGEYYRDTYNCTVVD